MNVFGFYCPEVPAFIEEFANTPAMQRLKDVGMNCGCEYTNFPLYRRIQPHSRYTHSIGTGLITWHFSHDVRASVAALLHDIATPAFSHTVDFLNGDYIRQESTEERTEAVIRNSAEICALLRMYGLGIDDVSDYHRYPIADNDSPRLSADRLEYSLSNMVNYGICSEERARSYYDDLFAAENEEGKPELTFKTAELAEEFAFNAVKCSRIYVAPEDRYSMQSLSEILSDAIACGIITRGDLYEDEQTVISLMRKNPDIWARWEHFRKLSSMVPAENNLQGLRVIDAKRRFIDPLAFGRGRVRAWSPAYKAELEDFLTTDFLQPISAI